MRFFRRNCLCPVELQLSVDLFYFLLYVSVCEISIYKYLVIYTMWRSSFRNLRLRFFLSSINQCEDKMVTCHKSKGHIFYCHLLNEILSNPPRNTVSICTGKFTILGLHLYQIGTRTSGISSPSSKYHNWNTL